MGSTMELTLEHMQEFILNGTRPDYEQYRDDLSKPLPPPDAVFTTDGRPLVTLGNLALIIGKAKTQKSMYAQLLAAQHLNPHSQRLGTADRNIEAAVLQNQRRGVLYFDTEQSAYQVSRLHRRIAMIAGRNLDINSDALQVYGLRELGTNERLAVVETAIADHAERCPVVVIDGIRDLIADINDPATSSDLVSKLLRWSSEWHCLIIGILHENKGTDHARGHLGTEAVNKAELVLQVSKDEFLPKDVRVINTPQARNAEPEPIYIFGHDETMPDGRTLWVVSYTTDVKPVVAGSRFAKASNLTPEDLQEIARTVFDGRDLVSASDCRDLVRMKLAAMQGAESCSQENARLVCTQLIVSNLATTAGTTKNKTYSPGSAFIRSDFPSTTEQNRLTL